MPTSQEVMSYLVRDLGYTPIAAAGLVGNLVEESGNFDPRVITGERTGDSGTAFGLAQWRGQRQANLRRFAQQNNIPLTDWRTQLQFINEESNPNSPYTDAGAVRARAEANSAKNIQDSTAAWLHFERPIGYTSRNPSGAHSYDKRVRHADLVINGKENRARSRAGAYVDESGNPATGRDERFDFYTSGNGYNDAYTQNNEYDSLTSAEKYVNSSRRNPLDFGIRPLENYKPFVGNPFGDINTNTKTNTQQLSPIDRGFNPFLDNPFRKGTN